jgi:hypothetical protein
MCQPLKHGCDIIDGGTFPWNNGACCCCHLQHTVPRSVTDRSTKLAIGEACEAPESPPSKSDFVVVRACRQASAHDGAVRWLSRHEVLGCIWA